MNNLKNITENALRNRVYSPNKVVSNEAANELIKRNAPFASKDYLSNLFYEEDSKPGIHPFGDFSKEGDSKEEKDSFSKEDINFLYKNRNFKFDGNSRLYLVSYDDTAVRVPSRKHYDSLMQIFEQAKIRGVDNKLPTDMYVWDDFEDKTHIDIGFYGGRFTHSDNEYYDSNKLNSMNLEQFLTLQRIPKKVLDELNHGYALSKPNRLSKGVKKSK